MASLIGSSIFRKQALVAILLVAATGTALALLEQVQVRTLLRQQVAERLGIEAERRQELILGYVHTQLQAVASVANRGRFRTLLADRPASGGIDDADRQALRGVLDDVVYGRRGFLAIRLSDPDGTVIAASDDGRVGQDLSNDVTFIHGKQRGYIGHVSLEQGRDRAIAAAPVRAADGELLAVIMVELDAEVLGGIVRRRTSLGESGEVLLAAPSGDRIRSLSAAEQLEDFPRSPTDGALLPMHRALREETGFVETADYRGVETLAAFRPVGFQGWGLVAKVDADEAYLPVTVFVRRLLIADSAIVAVGVVLVFLLVRRLTSPLKELTAAIEAFGRGDLDARVPVRTEDEIGALAEAFNRMAGQLARSRETDARLAAIVESSSDAIVSQGPDGVVTSWNQGAERLYGYSEAEMVGQTIERLYPEDGRAEGSDLVERVRRGGQVERRDTVHVRKDGSSIQVSLSISAIRDAHGGVTGVSAIAHDISDLRKMQVELEQRGRDLETLLYVTSHDLREPLRSIRSFSAMVNERYAESIDAKGRDFLRRVVRAAERMDELLQDVITVSRAQRTVEPSEELDAECIVEDALGRLEETIRETGARVRADRPLPTVHVDRLWATEAIYNLVGNALKFTRPQERPEIEIAAYAGDPDDPDHAAGLVVRDRGPGVPAEQAEMIFDLFQRGVGRDIGGTGAGLAIVRQVAERHGGRAWVQPREGGGSEFVITFGH